MLPAAAQSAPCCGHHHEEHHCVPKKKMTVMEVLEKISAVALIIFAAYVNPVLFIGFALLGLGVGIYNYCVSTKQHKHDGASACSQGFLEHLIGVKLPAPISLAANLAITACHIDHHSEIFVPIVGLTAGAWLGQNAMHYGSLLYRKIRQVRMYSKIPVAVAS